MKEFSKTGESPMIDNDDNTDNKKCNDYVSILLFKPSICNRTVRNEDNFHDAINNDTSVYCTATRVFKPIVMLSLRHL